MSYRSINSCSVGKGSRSNNRTQYNWFRCTSIEEAMEYWDSEIESGRHIDSFKTFESTTRKRPQSEGLGTTTAESEDRL